MALSLPTGRTGRLLALGITLLGAALAWQAVAAPLLGWYDDRAGRLEDREALAARMTGLAATLPTLRRELQSSDGTAPELLDGATDAVAAAALQERVQDLAGRSGATLTSLEILPVQVKGAYREIGVRVALNTTLPVMVRLLQAIADASPRMLVDDLQLRTGPLILAAAGPNGAAPHPPEPALDASIGVFAFRAGSR